ncbi:VOC family protein [Caulobacter mirabilis]|uniref:Glyoxalase n=1 Tax=Caulobacter mirabilis TaxID=69666 RepID=A0A2D2AZT7_9CAUL|nr:VOC family protein [Caulobacter mirabilis]ATQ43520.1 glyoxalase [Caulobacter mirabilis]
MAHETARRITFNGAHHVAFRCRDAEQTRWFYEDVLGLPLAAALIIEAVPGTHEDTPYLHMFFEVGDGKYLAFFDEPTKTTAQWFGRKDSFDMHYAIEARSEQDLLAMQARINAAGKSCVGPIDHGFVRSVYMYDPNGIQVEITLRTDRHDAIMAEEAGHARDQIAEWGRRTRETKIAKFGEAELSKRGSR